MAKRDRIRRVRDGQVVTLGPSAQQTPEDVEAEFDRSFAFGDDLMAEGTQEWHSEYRRVGPFKFLAYKEVGPPPWRFPRVGIQPWRKWPPSVRFIAGWRSTAYAIVVMWAGRRQEKGTK